MAVALPSVSCMRPLASSSTHGLRLLCTRHYQTVTFNQPWNYVDGRRCDPVDDGGLSFNHHEPATGNDFCTIPESGSADVDAAVDSARAGFRVWSKMSGIERGRILTAAGQRIRQLTEELAHIETVDTGKPIWESRFDVAAAADAFEYNGGVAASLGGRHVDLPGGNWAITRREPLGVVGGIGVWNFPTPTIAWKAAPALACGNSLVFKASPFTPMNALRIAEILTEAGLPAGCLNVLQGQGKAGQLLCQHPDIAKISFTGSVATGIAVLKQSADTMKHTTMELGGKSPLIVFDDADLVNALRGVLIGNFITQGAVCSAGTRVFVHRSIYDTFVEMVVDAANRMKIGDPMDEDVKIGATINAAHAQKVLTYIENAKSAGARILCGGERVPLPAPFENGWYLSPCVFDNVNDDDVIVKEEVFGCACAILPFDTEEEVIARANASPFGLAGGVFTRDVSRAHRVVNELQVGTAWINTYNFYPAEVPFGGYKMSGFGRENGLEVLNHYSQLKTVFVEMGDVDFPE